MLGRACGVADVPACALGGIAGELAGELGAVGGVPAGALGGVAGAVGAVSGGPAGALGGVAGVAEADALAGGLTEGPLGLFGSIGESYCGRLTGSAQPARTIEMRMSSRGVSVVTDEWLARLLEGVLLL